MKITIPVPVTFTTDAPRYGTRTALTFVPTDFDIAEATQDDAPVAATRFRQLDTMHSSYRVHEGSLYGTLLRNDGHRFAADIEYEITRHVAKRTIGEMADLRIDDLHPKDAKELMARVGSSSLNPRDDYEDYRRIVDERMKSSRMAALAVQSPDFEARREQAVAFASDEASRLLMVDGVRYTKNRGIAIAVNTDYNRQVKVSETEMWNGWMWTQRPEDANWTTEDMRTHYFAYGDRDEALAFAQEIGSKLGRRVHVDSDSDIAAFIPAEAFPKQNMRWAELVRSATMVAHYTGVEVARRIRNQESSIFTDDRSLRYAFDKLMEALDDTDAFGEPHDRLEVSARALLDLVRKDARAINDKYRNLVEKREAVFDHLDVSLARWDDRPLEIEVSYRQPGMIR
ncbi:hypothetical protein [Rhizobium sp. BK176]|uniref:hypothetical protein n=1 Tax=Rhizobium sp. BK176 TaxID=2587071 RepID=UPI00216945B1|nr:hypothetical protein [Rhizobium sp. BK176]MCS4089622.1 hypothetical protein [Rhizobium sp. BK176]